MKTEDLAQIIKDGAGLKRVMDAIERKILLYLLEENDWNQRKVAMICLVTRPGIRKKLQKHGIKIRGSQPSSSKPPAASVKAPR